MKEFTEMRIAYVFIVATVALELLVLVPVLMVKRTVDRWRIASKKNAFQQIKNELQSCVDPARRESLLARVHEMEHEFQVARRQNETNISEFAAKLESDRKQLAKYESSANSKALGNRIFQLKARIFSSGKILSLSKTNSSLYEL